MLDNYFKEYDFKPLNDYVKKIEKEIVDIKNNNFDNFNFDNGKFNILNFKLKSNLDLQIDVTELFGDTTVIFTFLNDGKIVETLYFSLYSFKLTSGANRTIYHEYYVQDGDNLTVYRSSFNYENNDYILGHESVRKLLYQEFHKKLSDEVLNNMLNPVNEIDVNNVLITFKHDEDILDEPTISNFSIDGISYESNYLKRLNELLRDTSLKDRYEEKKKNSSSITMGETNGFIDTHESREALPKEYYKSLKKTKSSIRKDIK